MWGGASTTRDHRSRQGAGPRGTPQTRTGDLHLLLAALLALGQACNGKRMHIAGQTSCQRGHHQPARQRRAGPSAHSRLFLPTAMFAPRTVDNRSMTTGPTSLKEAELDARTAKERGGPDPGARRL